MTRAAHHPPPLPMSPEEYQKWRLQLWSQRGPNVATPTYEELLPCYKAALERCKSQVSRPPPPPPPQPAPPPPASVVDAMAAAVRAGAEEPFYVVDLEAAKRKLSEWREALPEVVPHYAVKCNGDPALLLTLASEGACFDCASAAEIRQVRSLGVPASRIVYANPIKQPSHVRCASKEGVPLTVFDGEAELRKMAALAPSMRLLLRVAVDDSQAQCVLSNKYGARPAEAAALLDVAHGLGLTVVGVSFHVGSGSSSTDAFGDAVARAAAIFALAEQRGRPMSVLDVGGGFPGVDSAQVSFSSMAASLRAALDLHFPRRQGLRLIAEPGRLFAASTHTLAACVIGKKVARRAVDGGDGDGAEAVRINYFLNDGLYGSFNCVLYDHAAPECAVLLARGEGGGGGGGGGAGGGGSEAAGGEGVAACTVWGPTCDGIDCVIADAHLPELEVGDWLYFSDMGAYTSCAGSNFNAVELPDVAYLQGHAPSRPQPPETAAAEMLHKLAAEGVAP